MRLFPVIIGPTAGGKTALSVGLAHRLRRRVDGPVEIISADSMQVYRGMDIGTATPTIDEREGITHHLMDARDPHETFTVSEWLDEANALIAGIRERAGVPIVVGGTHLYVKALLDGLFDGPPADEATRAELGAMESAGLHAELSRVDPESASRIHVNDRRRMIRALEVFRLTGTPISAVQQQWDTTRRQDALLVALQWPAEQINPRINERVREMMQDGLLEEVRALHEADALSEQSREALGYKQLIEHLEGRVTLEEASERIKIETRRFAKSQRTWIRRLGVSGPAMSIEASEGTPEKWAESVERALFGG
ncbi:MAG: tRNA (adenosine(37)-N6)-dimethylallyltransferase MiaA [Phycisphaerales bacterium JB043]